MILLFIFHLARLLDFYYYIYLILHFVLFLFIRPVGLGWSQPAVRKNNCVAITEKRRWRRRFINVYFFFHYLSEKVIRRDLAPSPPSLHSFHNLQFLASIFWLSACNSVLSGFLTVETGINQRSHISPNPKIRPANCKKQCSSVRKWELLPKKFNRYLCPFWFLNTSAQCTLSILDCES